jgi:hypothetical protein
MSHALILSSDIEMPEFYGIEGFSVGKSYYDRDYCQEIKRFVKKEYYYSIDISTNKPALSSLKEYLTENIRPDGEIELWSVCLGGDFTKHYPTVPKISNIPAVVLDDVEDSVDYYAENNFNPVIREVSIRELSVNDISFMLDHTGVCLIVRHKK